MARVRQQPLGVVTRGTTNPNRLRRMDRWVAHAAGPLLGRPGARPLVVDLGFGASPVTTVELYRRLQALRPGVRVLGLDVEAGRVQAALPKAEPPGLDFAVGGFELPVPDGDRPQVVRAANVLRQYTEEDVGPAWAAMTARLAPGGLVVEGTCDEVGRLGSWVAVRRDGDGRPVPESLTLSWRLPDLVRPSVVAERLPKALIHRNVPGEGVHALLADLDGAWDRAAPLAAYGPRQRFLAAVSGLRARGWPVLDGPRRWRLGELGVAWEAVRPQARS